MSTEKKKPNWEVWKHFSKARAWEAIALSLDIDPTSVRHIHDPDEAFVYEGQEFRDRLFVFGRSESANATIKTLARSMGDGPPMRLISLPDFVRWASSIWEIPPEFAAIAPNTALQISDSNADAGTPATNPPPLRRKGTRAGRPAPWADWSANALKRRFLKTPEILEAMSQPQLADVVKALIDRPSDKPCPKDKRSLNIGCARARETALLEIQCSINRSDSR